MTDARGHLIASRRQDVQSTRPCITSRSFTSSCSFGLPFGFPLVPLGRVCLRGFSLRLCRSTADIANRPSSRLRQVEVRLFEQHVAQARGRPGCKAEPASNDISELWPRNSSEAGELSLRQASALPVKFDSSPTEGDAMPWSNSRTREMGFARWGNRGSCVSSSTRPRGEFFKPRLRYVRSRGWRIPSSIRSASSCFDKRTRSPPAAPSLCDPLSRRKDRPAA